MDGWGAGLGLCGVLYCIVCFVCIAENRNVQSFQLYSFVKDVYGPASCARRLSVLHSNATLYLLLYCISPAHPAQIAAHSA